MKKGEETKRRTIAPLLTHKLLTGAKRRILSSCRQTGSPKPAGGFGEMDSFPLPLSRRMRARRHLPPQPLLALRWPHVLDAISCLERQRSLWEP